MCEKQFKTTVSSDDLIDFHAFKWLSVAETK